MKVRISSLIIKPGIEDLDPGANPIQINQYNWVIAGQRKVLELRGQGVQEIEVRMVQTDCDGRPVPERKGNDLFYSDGDLRRITGNWRQLLSEEISYDSRDVD